MSSSTVTYTSLYNDSEPGRVFWGADEEPSDGEMSPRNSCFTYSAFRTRDRESSTAGAARQPGPTLGVDLSRQGYETLWITKHTGMR
ncbi:hypothetical protein Tco_0002847 [Tanacetum coccineum]